MTLHTLDRHALNGRTPFAQVVRTTVGGQPVAAIHVGHGVWHQTSPEPLTDPDDLWPFVGADILTPISRLYDMAERCDALTNLRDHYKRTANALYSITERAVQAAMTAERADTDEARLTAYQAMRSILSEMISLEARAAA